MITSVNETSKANSLAEAQPSQGKGEQIAKQILRWYTITPNRVLIAVLVWTSFLYLSKHFVWFEFNRHKGWTVLIAVASVVVVLLAFGLWRLASWLWRLRTNRSAPAFQFSLATLLLFVPVVGITCGWFGKELRQARKQAAIVEALRGQGAEMLSVDLFSQSNFTPNFCREWFGEYLIHEVVCIRMSKPIGLEHLKELTQLRAIRLGGTSITDAGLEHLKGLNRLEDLYLDNTSITDAGLEHLKGLTQLRLLDLSETSITDAGLVNLKGLTHLRLLDLSETSITVAGLEYLKGLNRLEDLYLNNTSITDAGLEYLKGLTQLTHLGVRQTSITDAGFMELEKSLPNCRIWLY